MGSIEKMPLMACRHVLFGDEQSEVVRYILGSVFQMSSSSFMS